MLPSTFLSKHAVQKYPAPASGAKNADIIADKPPMGNCLYMQGVGNESLRILHMWAEPVPPLRDMIPLKGAVNFIENMLFIRAP